MAPPKSNSRQLPHLVALPPVADLLTWVNTGEVVLPKFPNWQKSFVSGPQSPLFKIEHRIHPAHPQALISRVQFLPLSEGPPGHVHGGASAGLLDEVLGVCVWNENLMSVTQSLKLHYGRALPLKVDALIICQIRKVSDTTVDIEGTIYDFEGTPYVSAQGVFHRLTLEQLQKFAAHRNWA